ncbi:MAG: protein phosphatase 2C domain-containing protein, partial [Deltaproteobacteria bacterium]|nr:protein phosphatase 2C domain-containing protein [Deltaproteobacteria bacterium]
GLSDVGRERVQNEDSFYVDDERRLYVVADGMGGHASGEVASATAIEAVSGEVGRRYQQLGKLREGLIESEVLSGIAREIVDHACTAIYNKARANQEHAGMGCTLTMLLVVAHKAVMAHVGDTRLYLLRKGKADQISSDHTMAQELCQAGLLEPDEVDDHQFAHILSRALGPLPSVQVDTLVMDVLPGDRFLLCSDGLTAYVEDEGWLAQQLVGDDPEIVPEELVSYANAAGGQDNVTAVLVELRPDDPEIEIVDEMSVDLQVQFDALGSVFLFEALSLALLTRLLNHCELNEYVKDDTVIREGDPCEQLMVVVDGHFEVSHLGGTDGELMLGDHTGATTLLSPRRARATVTAKDHSRLLILKRKPFWKLIRRRPWLGVNLLERLGRRLSQDLDRSIEKLEDHDPETTVVKPRERL